MEASTSPTFAVERARPEGVTAQGFQTGANSPAQVLEAGAALDWLSENPIEKSAYWEAYLRGDSARLIANLRTQAGLVTHGGNAYPITVNERSEDNAYPCSLRAQYVRYPLAELELVEDRWLRRAAWAGLRTLDLALLAGRADQVVQWNSWLLSTNLIPASLLESVPAVTESLLARFPRHAIHLKNVTAREHPELPAILQRVGYDLIVSRQVYFFRGCTTECLQRSTMKRDLKHLREQDGYEPMEPGDFAVTDAARVAELYRRLYLEKHSSLNPQFTEEFVAGAIREGWLELRGLRHDSGRIDGVFGCFRLGGTTSTPFIGYDTSLPQELGLYRMLFAMLLRRVTEEQLLLNYSSGAGEFKRRRGGEPAIEFNAVYSRHLGPRRRACYRLLGELSNRFGRRFLEENEI